MKKLEISVDQEGNVKIISQTHRGVDFSMVGDTWKATNGIILRSMYFPGYSPKSMFLVRGQESKHDNDVIIVDVDFVPKLLEAVREYNVMHSVEKVELPDTIWGLVEVAIKDFTSVLDDKTVDINMLEWVTTWQNKCQVCLAGSVLYCSFGHKKTARLDDIELQYGKAVITKLFILDHIRTGRLFKALATKGIENVKVSVACDLEHLGKLYIQYNNDRPLEFVAWLEEVARKLKEHGI